MNEEKTRQEFINEKLLYLMPLVQTAWAHGAIAGREKHLIFAAAREDGINERDSLNDELADLLVYQPSRKFFADCLEQIREDLNALTVKRREALKSKILRRARQVAESAGGNSAMDVRAFVSREEIETLAEIIEVLEIKVPERRRESLAARNSSPVFV